MSKTNLVLAVGILCFIGASVWVGFFREAPHFEEVVEEPAEETPQYGGVRYENASSDMVRILKPLPGDVVSGSVVVHGEARGFWFFEGIFPVSLVTPDGTVLVSSGAMVQGGEGTEVSWMTEDFVPFRAVLEIESDYRGPATLMLRRDNPSGLPENDASASFPVIVQ